MINSTHSVIHVLASLGELFKLPDLHIQVDRAVNECPKKYEAVIGDDYTPIIILPPFLNFCLSRDFNK